MAQETQEQLRDRALNSSSIEEKVAIARQLGATDEDIEGTLGRLGGYEQYYSSSPQEAPQSTYNFDVVTVDVTPVPPVEVDETPLQLDNLLASSQQPTTPDYQLDSLLAESLAIGNDVYASNMAVIGMAAHKALLRGEELSDENYARFLNDFERWRASRIDMVDKEVAESAIEASTAKLQSDINGVISNGIPVEEAIPSIVESARGALPESSSPRQVAANVVSGPQFAESSLLGYSSYLADLNTVMGDRGIQLDGGFWSTAAQLWTNSWSDALNSTLSVLLAGYASALNYAIYDFGNFDMRDYQKMSVSEQEKIRKDVMKRLMDKNAPAFDRLVVMSLLDPYTPPALEETFLFLDVLGGLAALGSVIKILNRISDVKMANRLVDAQRQRRATGNAASIGANELAGELGARVISGGAREAKASQTDRLSVLLEAAPFEYDQIDKTLVPNLSPKINRRIERQKRVAYLRLVEAAAAASESTAGILRSGAEEATAFERISKSLPENATIIERNQYGVRVRITFENKSKFATEEERLAAIGNHEKLVLEHEAAVNRRDALIADLVEANGGVYPEAKTIFDTPWVEQLRTADAEVALAKSKYEAAEKILDIGLGRDKIEEKFIFYTLADDVTGFNGDVRVASGQKGFLGRGVTSPDISLQDVDPLPNMPVGSGGMVQMVLERTSTLSQQDKLRKVFEKAIREIYNRGGASSKASAILIHGRNTNTVWTADELYKGIDVPGHGTIRLTPKEIETYIGMRMLSDTVHSMASSMKYRELGSLGFTHEAMFLLPNGSRKKIPLEIIKFLPEDVRRIYDDTGRTNNVVGVDDAFKAKIKKKIESGEVVLVRLNKPIHIPSQGTDPANRLNYALVKRSKVADLGPNQLPKVKGYVPTDYIEVPYVVRFRDDIFIDGVKKARLFTSRFFSSKQEAEVFAQSEKLRTGKEYIVDVDRAWRESDPSYRAEMNDSALTGLYYDERGEQIPFGMKGELAPTDDPHSAMERYLANIAHAMPMNDFRMSVMERYQKSFSDFLANPAEWYMPKPEFKPGVPFNVAENITNTRDWIRHTLSISEPGERAFARAARAAIETTEKITHGTVLDKARVRALYGVTDWDALRTLRRATFYSLLGGNPIQFIVQMSNIAFIAMSHPITAAKIALPPTRFLAARVAHSISSANPSWSKIMDSLAISAAMRPSKFKDMILSMEKTGFIHLAYVNNDLAARARGLSPGGNLADIGRSLKTVYTSMYTEGDIWARLYGWMDSYIRLSKKNKGVSFADNPEKLKELFAEATRISSNYTAANSAYWQRSDTAWQNILSTALQFSQPIIKQYENLVLPMIPGGNYQSRWTKAERGGMVFGGLLLFGAYGTPASQLTQEAITDLLEKWTGKSRDQFDPDTVTKITGGYLDLLGSEVVRAITGEENAYPQISQRVSLVNLDAYIKKFTDPSASFWDIALGPNTVLPKRMIAAVSSLAPILKQKKEFDQLTSDDYVSFMSTMGQALSSGYSNYQRARLWKTMNAIYYNEFGNAIYPIDSSETNIITMKMFGITSAQELAAWELQDRTSKLSSKVRMDEAEQALNDIMMYYYKNEDVSDPKVAQMYTLYVEGILDSLTDSEGNPEPVLQAQVRKRFLDKMVDRNTSIGKIFEKYLDEKINSVEEFEAPLLYQRIRQKQEPGQTTLAPR